MASRTLAVTLKADIGAYQRAMARAAGETDNFTKKLGHVARAGASMSRLGDTLTSRVTLPLVAVGAAAAKLAIDFDTSMSRIVGLVGLSRDEVDSMRESVLDLAGQTAKSPQELADALFAITSAGIRGAEAMDVLEASAKASAAGLGSTRDIAEATTAVLNTYGSDVISAAEATDIMVATARAGNFETSQFAGALGRVIPFANAANVSFEDVGGAIALLTRSNNDANESITQTQALFRAFVRPTQQAQTILKEMGLTAQDVRDSMGEKGLVATLQMLDERLGGNREQLGRIIEDSTGFAAAIQILDADAQTLTNTFGTTADAAGMVDSAFAAFAESAGFKSKQAFANLQASLIQLGDTLIPIVNQVVAFGAAILSAFDGLPGGAKLAIVYFGLVLAAVGPLLSIGGRLMTTMALLSSTLSTLATSAGPLAPALNAAAAATGRFSLALGTLTKATFVVGALFALREVLGTVNDEIDKANLSELENQLLKLGTTGKTTGDTLKRVFAGIGEGDASTVMRQFASDLDLLDDALAKLAARDPDAAAAAFEKISDALRGQGASVDQVNDAFDGYRGAVAEAETASQTAEGAFGDAEDAMAQLGLETGETVSALQALADELRAQFDPLFGMVDALQANAEAQADVIAAQDALNEAVKEHGKGSAEAKDAQEALTAAHRAASGTALDVVGAMAALNDAIAENPALLGDSKRQLETWVAQGLISEETAAEMGRQFDVTAQKAVALGRTDPNVAISETGGSRVRGSLSAVQQAAINAGRQKPNVRVTVSGVGNAIGQLNRIPRTINTTVQVGIRGHQTVSGTLGGLTLHEGGYVPGTRGQEVAAILQAGERVLSLSEVDAMSRGIPLTGAGAGGGGGVIHASFHFHGPVASTAEAERFVVGALRRAADNGVPITLRGRSL